MPASNVSWPTPLTRFQTLFPGQMGVPGTDSETGLRQHCTGAIFWVDPNHHDTNDNRDGTNPNAPMATIQAALGKCASYQGDVVAVMANGAWRYGARTTRATAITENVTVTVDGVRIVGVFPSSSLGVPWTVTSGNVGITVHAMDVVIEGFCFVGSGGGTAISAVWNSDTNLYGENMVVRNCYFDYALDNGIMLNYAWNCLVHDNQFYKCDYGIKATNAEHDVQQLYVFNNSFYDCGSTAIHLSNSEKCVIHDNQFFASSLVGGNEFVYLTAGANNLVGNNLMGCNVGGGTYASANVAGTGDFWAGNVCQDGLSNANP